MSIIKNNDMNFQFANVSELNNGVTMHELCAVEGLAIYVSANRMKESIRKTEADLSVLWQGNVKRRIRPDRRLRC